MINQNVARINPSQEDMQTAFYRELPNKIHVIPVYYPQERWLPLIRFPEIRDWYFVSDYGRVYSRKHDAILRQRFVGRGYKTVTFACIDGSRTDKLIHRLVMETFQPIENSDQYQVNHKDCNKTNNMLYNLEWATGSENMIHAYANGLYRNGQDNNFAVITNEQAHLICACLDKGYSYQQICDALGIEYNKKTWGIIYHIKKGNNWKHVSCEYNFLKV